MLAGNFLDDRDQQVFDLQTLPLQVPEINTKVNETDERYRTYFKSSIFDNKVIEQIGQACMSFNKLIKPKETPQIEE